MVSNAHAHTHHRFVYGVTLEKVREPRVRLSALKSRTRTITRKPSVATATKWPDNRIRTRPTNKATSDTKQAAITVAATKPSGKGPKWISKCTPASQVGRF